MLDISYFQNTQNLVGVLCKKDQRLRYILGNQEKIAKSMGAVNFKLSLSFTKEVNAYLPSKPKGNLQDSSFIY